jgi:hypothetical protein
VPFWYISQIRGFPFIRSTKSLQCNKFFYPVNTYLHQSLNSPKFSFFQTFGEKWCCQFLNGNLRGHSQTCISLTYVWCVWFANNYEHHFISASFLGTFAKLQKATISFVLSVRPSIRVEQLCPYSMDFHEIWYLRIFQKSVGKIQVWLKSNKDDGYITQRSMYV